MRQRHVGAAGLPFGGCGTPSTSTVKDTLKINLGDIELSRAGKKHPAP
ncbi:hypothetical protein [Streptomyces sp. NPDC002587]